MAATTHLLDLGHRRIGFIEGPPGAMVAIARTLGLRVPEDVSVVGFDDINAAKWSAPPLTTVRQPFAEMGRVAMRRLLRLIAGEVLASPRIELATQLIIRKSTAVLSGRRKLSTP